MTDTTERAGIAHRAAAGEGDRLREQLLDAAEAQLVDRGSLQAVSLRQVARDVGVSPTAVYLHFEDKDDLFIHVCQRRFAAFAELLRQARLAHDRPVDQLRACGTAYVRFGLEHPEQYAVLFGGLSLDEVVQRIPEDELVGLQALEELAAIIARGVDVGEFREVEPYPTAVATWAMVHGLVGVVTHGAGKAGAVDADALVDHTLDMVLHGLTAR